MARITPKTNWVASDIPVATDFNRIENNSEQAFAELDATNADLDAETSARIAGDNAEAAARIAGDNAEAAARIAANISMQTLGDIGSFAILRPDISVLQGDVVSASLLRYTNVQSVAGNRPSAGQWRCMGETISGVATLFVRIS